VGFSVSRATKLALCVFVLVFVFAAAVSLLQDDQIADRDELDALVGRVASESAVVTNDYLARAEISVRVVAVSLAALPSAESQSLVFANVIRQSDQIDAVYVGRPNGDFHFVGRSTDDDALPTDNALVDNALVDTALANAIIAFRSREIREAADGRQSTERWFDAELSELATPVVTNAEFDPRERPWYIGAIGSDTPESWSDPYVFFSSQEIGITYSIAVTDDAGEQAVVCADIVLGELINFLEQRLPTPGSLALVLDRSGSVLATSDLSAERSSAAAVDQRILDAFLPSVSNERSSTEPVLIHLEDESTPEGEGSIVAIAPVGALDKWSLIVIAPENELIVGTEAGSQLLTTLVVPIALAALIALVVLAASHVLRLRSAAQTDALTGLISRYEIVRRLGGPLTRGQSSGALAIVDLNGFKRVNDEHGHDVGDFVLRETARRLAASLPRTATVGRLGGDEFVIVLRLDANPVDQIKGVLAALAEPIAVGRGTVEIGGSAGITFFNESEPTTLQRVLREADLALYAAKDTTSSPVRIFHRSMETREDSPPALWDDAWA